MRPERVTICPALAQGGITHYSYALAEALQALGVETNALYYDTPPYDLTDFPHAHRVLRRLQLATSRRARITSPLANVAGVLSASWSSPIVHFQWSLGPRNDRVIWPLLRRLGKRIVYTAHDVLPHESAIMSREHCQWTYAYADALFVHGERLKKLMLSEFRVEARKIQVIPLGNSNFMADTPSRWQRANARESFGFTDDDRVVLFFGLIRAYKGLDDLLEACGQLRERGLTGGRLRVLIAGRDFKGHWAERDYDAIIRRAGLSDALSIHMRHIEMSEIPRFFQAADVVAVPYKRGSQSAVLELAYSFSKPAVATRVGSLAELEPHAITRFVEPERPEELAEALRELLLDPAKADALGARARRYVDTELDWRKIAETTLATYQRLLEAG